MDALDQWEDLTDLGKLASPVVTRNKGRFLLDV